MNTPDVLMIAHYTDASHSSNNRFRELSRILASRGLDVELVTSSFLHHAKTQRDNEDVSSEPYRITHLHEPDYSANISFGRLRSHRALARNLIAYLRQRDVPDVIYCAIPSDAIAAAAVDYANQHEVRLLLDVQDLWPEAYEMVLKPKSLAHFALTPLRIRADRIYRAATAVVTVSDTYSERVDSVREDRALTTYLGTNLAFFDSHEPEPWDTSDPAIQLAYIGTLGHSYDLPLVFDAVRILKNQNREVRLHLMGSGPLEQKWQEATQDIRDQVRFHGELPYPEMVSRLRSVDVAMNPIVPGAAQSIVNKVCDYGAAGLPVVSTQDCEEYRKLLKTFNAGISCPPDPAAVAAAVAELSDNPEIRKQMGEGSRLLAENHFDRAVTYERLADLVVSEIR